MIRDLTKLMRAHRKKRQECCHRLVKTKRNGVERCTECGDQYPCRGLACYHIDCIEQACRLGLRSFPANLPYAVTVLDKRGRLVLDVDPEVDPLEWIVPLEWGLG